MSGRLRPLLAIIPVAAIVALVGLPMLNRSGSSDAVGAQGTSATSGHLDWGPWSLDWDVDGARYDGLSMSDVSFDDRPVLKRASLPVMRVFYDGNACGPYADRLGPGSLLPVSWAGDELVVQRSFVQDERNWLELGILGRIGAYRIYQVWYLSDDGIVDAHIFSKALQCNIDHLHYPYWRMDFDLDGAADDRILSRSTGGDWATRTTEFDASLSDAAEWRIEDTRTGFAVDVLSGLTDYEVPGAPNESDNDDIELFSAFGRQYRAAEDIGWIGGARAETPYGNAEPIDGTDVVFWYKARMSHLAAEGPELWHSAGPRFQLDVATSTGNEAPVIRDLSADPLVLVGEDVDLLLTANDPDGDPLTWSAGGLPDGVAIDETTGRITGAAVAAQIAAVTVSVTDGELSDTTSFSLRVQEPPQTGSTITVFAAGKSGEETVELEIDGEVEAVFTNVGGDFANGTSQTLTYEHPVPVVAEQLRVLFTNNNGPARDVRIDAIRIDAVTVQSEAGYSEGHWDRANGCAGGFEATEVLHCNGFISYATPTDGTGGGSSIEILAAGKSGTEMVQLLIDDIVVETFVDVGGDFANGVFVGLSYEHDAPVPPGSIKVAFANNEGSARDLRVDAIVVDGTRIEAETVYSNGHWDEGNGCGPGFESAEVLHCNGFFDFGQTQ